MFWLCLIVSSALTILALARPTADISLLRTAGVDLVILQDGSASMRTRTSPATAGSARCASFGRSASR